MSDEFLTLREFAEKIGMSERFIRRKIDEGIIESYRFGSRVRIRKSEVEKFIRKSKDTSGGNKARAV